tara:strand:- start:235 stop:417 length:183 start_codon:yes stop_codon:yes gene_type:complete
MNSFDKIQIEESAEYQLFTILEELDFLSKRIEASRREVQKELDELSDQYIEENLAAEIDF